MISSDDFKEVLDIDPKQDMRPVLPIPPAVVPLVFPTPLAVSRMLAAIQGAPGRDQVSHHRGSKLLRRRRGLSAGEETH